MKNLPYQEFELFKAESVGTAKMICQPARRRNDNVGFAGELQGLCHHVCSEKHAAVLQEIEPYKHTVRVAGKHRSGFHQPQIGTPWTQQHGEAHWPFCSSPACPRWCLSATHPGRPPPHSPSGPAASPAHGTARRSGRPAPCREGRAKWGKWGHRTSGRGLRGCSIPGGR